jgi:hypothetical protein
MTVIAVKRHAGINVDALAKALQFQLAEVATAWNISAPSVVAYSSSKPKGSWRIQFYSSLPPGMGGVHMNTAAGLPYAKVLVSEGSLAASHEACEMLVDPEGTRFQQVGLRNYLVEVCDPCERISYTYGPLGVPVSDFITPAWYGISGMGDHLGKNPALNLLPGGYVSWIEGGHWWQEFKDSAGHTTKRNLGLAKLGTRREKDILAAR